VIGWGQFRGEIDRPAIQAKVDALAVEERRLVAQLDDMTGAIERTEVWRRLQEVREERKRLIGTLWPSTRAYIGAAVAALAFFPVLALLLPAVAR